MCTLLALGSGHSRSGPLSRLLLRPRPRDHSILGILPHSTPLLSTQSRDSAGVGPPYTVTSEPPLHLK